MCTNDETTSTGNSIDTVRLSKRKPQLTSIDSESIQLAKQIDTGLPDNPTSQNATIDNKADITSKVHVMMCAPVTPIFRPRKPAEIAPSRGRVKIVRYIYRNEILPRTYFLTEYYIGNRHSHYRSLYINHGAK